MRWVLLLLLLPGAAAQAVVVAVVPDLSVPGPGDEGFALAPTDGPVDLRGWTVTDGEGTWRLPPIIMEGETWFAGDAAAWAQRDGPTPAAEFGTTLRLANDGDEVVLHDPAGREVDSMAYGGALAFAGADMMWRRLPADPGREPAAGVPDSGWTTAGAAEGKTAGMGTEANRATAGHETGGTLVRRAPSGWIDTDSADDWRTPRIHRVGESRLEMPRFEVDALTAYASPDSTFSVLTELMRGTTQRLHLHVYERRGCQTSP